MSIKTISKAIILVLILMLSFCGCTSIKSAVEDVPKLVNFTTDIVEVTQISDPEQAKIEAKKLIHPKSDFTLETILEKAQADEDLEGIDLKSLSSTGYSIGNFSEPKIKFNDPQAGGNIYEIKVNLTIEAQVFRVTIDVLSDELGVGLYDFDISK